MASYHMRTDMSTGETVFIGRSGRVVDTRDLARIQAAARAGDAEALAIERDLDVGIDEEGQALDRHAIEALAAQVMDDCPECQAARARGEVPVIMGPDHFAELARTAPAWLRELAAEEARRPGHETRATRRRKILKADRRRRIERQARAANRRQ